MSLPYSYIIRVCQAVSPSPTPPLAGRMDDGRQASGQGDPKGWGCGSGTMRPCNGIYILFSVPLCFSNSVPLSFP